MKKGNLVRVVRPGKTYSTYDTRFVELGFKNTKQNDAFREGTIAEIFGITRHENGLPLYGIRDSKGKESLISEDGIELVEELIFKKGDTVCVVRNNIKESKYYGLTGVIEDVNHYYEYPYKVKTDLDMPGQGIWSTVKEASVKPDKAPTIQELIYEKQGFKVGDVVTVTHKVPSRDLGWNNPWMEDMDESVGEVGVIENILVDYGVRIDFGKTLKYYFPPQALKKVDIKFVEISKDCTAKVYPGKKIEVGCQTITPEIFNEIKNAFEGK